MLNLRRTCGLARFIAAALLLTKVDFTLERLES